MNLAFLLQSPPARKEWLIQGEDVIMTGIAAMAVALLLLLHSRFVARKVQGGRSYRTPLVLLGFGIILLIAGYIMFRLNPPGFDRIA